MKSLLLLWGILLAFWMQNVTAQDFSPEKIYVVTKNDGSTYVGKIISSDVREVILETTSLGQIAIPKHEIRSISEERPGVDTETGKDIFSTRYFLTSNGFPIEKGDSYVQWTLVGPDIQFGVADNFGVGFLTTWVATPVALSLKYSAPINDDFSYAVGTLLGGNLWNFETFNFALPFVSITKGNESANITATAGYGYAQAFSESGGQFLYSLAGLKKLTRKGTLVFDSFIVPNDGNLYAFLVPGYRIQTGVDAAFQIGFPGLISSDSSTPVGFPMVSWFRKF